MTEDELIERELDEQGVGDDPELGRLFSYCANRYAERHSKANKLAS